MVKFLKKHKSHLKNTKVKKNITKAKNKVPGPRKVWTFPKGEQATHPLKIEEVTSSVTALLQVIEKKKEESKKALFKDDSQPIMLQVQAVKVPETPKLQLRTILSHPLAIEKSDVCFITPNVSASTKDNHEPTILHYKELLQKEKITNKIEIVPIRQLRSECMTYETKGRFANLYDLYLVDGRLLGKVTKTLGSRFFKKHNMLIPVKVNTSKFKHEMEKALATTAMTVHGQGDSYTVQIGYSHFSTAELVANICAVANMLANRFPGGFANIRRLLVKSKYSMAIPVYISLTPANKVPVPVVKRDLPKAYKAVEGELTTVFGGQVKVYPSGKVHVKKVFTEEDEEMGFVRLRKQGIQSVPMRDKDNDKEEKEVSKVMVKKRKKEDEEQSADDNSNDDDDVETAEDAFLLDLQDRPKPQPSGQKTNLKGKKQKKVNPKPGNKKVGLSATPATEQEGQSKKKRKQKNPKGVTTPLNSPVAGTSKDIDTPGSKRIKSPMKTPSNKKKVMVSGDTLGSKKAKTPSKAPGLKMMKKGLSPGSKNTGSPNKTPGNKMEKSVTPGSKKIGSPIKTPGNKMMKKSITPNSNKKESLNKTPCNKMMKKSVTPGSTKTGTPNITGNKKVKLLKNDTPGITKTDTPKKTVTPGSKKTKSNFDTPVNQSVEMFKTSNTSGGQRSTVNSRQSSGRYFTPENVKELAQEGVPVTGKSSGGKKQLKKKRLSLAVSEKEVGTQSLQKVGKRRESSSITPKPKKMKDNNSMDVSAELGKIHMNGEIHSAKALKSKNAMKNKDQKSAKKRRSSISDKRESGDGSFTRYFSKENQKT